MRPLMGSRSRKKEGGTDNNVPNSPKGYSESQAPSTYIRMGKKGPLYHSHDRRRRRHFSAAEKPTIVFALTKWHFPKAEKLFGWHCLKNFPFAFPGYRKESVDSARQWTGFSELPKDSSLTWPEEDRHVSVSRKTPIASAQEDVF